MSLTLSTVQIPYGLLHATLYCHQHIAGNLIIVNIVNQVSSCGETDPEVTSLAKQDPAKLQRLHDRLTSTTSTRPTVGAQKQGVGASGGGESRLTLSPSSPWSQVKSLEQRVPLKKAGEVNDFHVSTVQVRALTCFMLVVVPVIFGILYFSL